MNSKQMFRPTVACCDRLNMMKLLATMMFAGFLLMFPTHVFAAARPDIITRAEYGAEDFYLEDAFTPADLEVVETEEGDEKSEQVQDDTVTKHDPEIESIVRRAANGKQYLWPLEYRKETHFIVIHHTALKKNLDNPKLAVKNIQRYHALGRGWGDVGYHYLIDQQGRIYEGRQGGDGVIGGHLPSLNKVSIGIAVLGNYEEDQVSEEAIFALRDLTAYLTDKYDINPLGSTTYKNKTYKNIIGHKDADATLCPGRYVYRTLPALRTMAYHAGRASSSGGNGDEYAFASISTPGIARFDPDSSGNVTLQLKNTGTKSWLRTSTFLSLPEAQRDSINFSDTFEVARMKEASVAPGETATFPINFKTTYFAGLNAFDLVPVLNGTMKTAQSLLLPVVVKPVDLSFEITRQTLTKKTMKKGQIAPITVQLKNLGNVTWRKNSQNPVTLLTADGKNLIATLDETEVKPGQTGTFSFTVTAPSVSGTHRLMYRPVLDGVTWFDPDQDISVAIEIPPDPKPAVSRNLPDMRVKLSYAGDGPARVGIGGDGKGFFDVFFGYDRVRGYNRLNQVTISFDERYQITDHLKTFDGNAPVRVVPRNGAILEVKNFGNQYTEYRGNLEFWWVDGRLEMINVLPLEDYVRGIAEVPNDTPTEKIKTMMILARSYAYYYMTEAEKFPGKPWHLEDSPSTSQMYRGYNFEKRAPNVSAGALETRGKILKYNGKTVKPPYFHQSDGRTRSAEEVWGWKDTPFLVSVPDPCCTGRALQGHGVGLSGEGALKMAREGKMFDEIINYYYRGVAIERAW